jgi:hypothetical protein
MTATAVVIPEAVTLDAARLIECLARLDAQGDNTITSEDLAPLHELVCEAVGAIVPDVATDETFAKNPFVVEWWARRDEIEADLADEAAAESETRRESARKTREQGTVDWSRNG